MVLSWWLQAIQCLGGNGYVNEYPTGRLLRDAKLYEIGAGTSEIRRMLIGRELFKEGWSMKVLLSNRFKLKLICCTPCVLHIEFVTCTDIYSKTWSYNLWVIPESSFSSRELQNYWFHTGDMKSLSACETATIIKYCGGILLIVRFCQQNAWQAVQHTIQNPVNR